MSSRRVEAVLVAVVGMLVVAASTVLPTASAWTDEVVAQTTVAAGQWVRSAPPHPFHPGEATTKITAVDWTFTSTGSAGFCAAVSVSTDSTVPVPWSVGVDLDAAPYWGASASSLWIEGGTASITTVAHGARIAGPNAIVAGWPILVRVCTGDGHRPPVADSSWFHVTSATVGTWTRTQACVQTTVAGDVDEASYPYFYGWAGSVDMSAAIESVRAAGGTPTHISWTPDSGSGYQYDLSAHPSARYGNTAVADVFDISSGVGAALRGRGTYTVTACVNAY